MSIGWLKHFMVFKGVINEHISLGFETIQNYKLLPLYTFFDLLDVITTFDSFLTTSRVCFTWLLLFLCLIQCTLSVTFFDGKQTLEQFNQFLLYISPKFQIYVHCVRSPPIKIRLVWKTYVGCMMEIM